MNQNKNNNLLDCFKKPSENLKNFIVKYELWYYHKSIENFRDNIVLDKDKLLKSLSSLIMKEKKDNEYLFCSSLYHAGQDVNDKEFFYGNKNQVKDKITSYLLKRNKYCPLSFFAVYDFVNDYESGIGYGSNLVKGKIEYDVKIE
jgi:hypothetical protein